MYNRSIIHFDLETFFVSCERLLNPGLKGIPLIVGGSSDRGVVLSCSKEAQYYGVRSSMPVRLALQHCPNAKVIRGDLEHYSDQSSIITEIIAEQAPIMEKAGLSEFYVDGTGLDRFFGCLKWSTELQKRISKETGLPVNFGLSVNKTVAKMANGERGSSNYVEIPSTEVRPFLSPLAVRKIPGIGRVHCQTLSRIGVRKIYTLAEMPVEVLQRIIGKQGQNIWKKANGIDSTPVVPYDEKKSISIERTFDKDSIDLIRIRSMLTGMVEKLAFELRQKQKLTSVVSVKLRYTNLDVASKQKKIAHSASDGLLIQLVLDLFDRIYERRMLIRMIGIRFSGLVSGAHQINLFDGTPEKVALYQALDRMKHRYGNNAVRRCTSFEFEDKIG